LTGRMLIALGQRDAKTEIMTETRRVALPGLLLLAAAVFFIPPPGPGLAQEEEDDALVRGVPLENVIVDRATAYRFRAEYQTTGDDDDLIDSDPAYSRFPSRMFDSELRIFQSDKLSIAGSYSIWENDQEMDDASWGWKMKTPVARNWWFTLRYRHRQSTAHAGDKDYIYARMSRSFKNNIYSSTQFNLTSRNGETDSAHVSEYLSWHCNARCRVGAKVLAAHTESSSKSIGPWYIQLFSSCYIVPDVTSLLLDARHYESSGDLDYQEVNAHLYQRLGAGSFVKLSYRLYDDNDDLSSHAWGVKLKHYFSARFSAHAGYRFYNHSAGPDLDTFIGGIGLLL